MKAPLSAVLVLLLLFVQTLAASEIFHLDVHDDAHAADHSCAVTTLSQGQVDLADSVVSLELPPAARIEFQRVAAPLFLPLFFSVDSSRGPPSLA